MMRHVHLPVWVGLGLCLLAGCAGSQRERYLGEKATEHVYKQPLAEMWPRVKAVIDDQGYYFEEAPQGFLLQTDWKQTAGSGELGRTYVRLLVEGTEVKGEGSRVRVLRLQTSAREVLVNPEGRPVGPITSAQSSMVDSGHGNYYTIQTELWKRSERDPQLEWELLRALEPETAAAVEKDAATKFPK
jgi:hypothetical protein